MKQFKDGRATNTTDASTVPAIRPVDVNLKSKS